jgi:hypothetical protein
MIRGKKAAEEGLTIWAVITCLTLAMIVFSIITFISPRKEMEIKLMTTTIEDSKLNLINYLKTPVGDTGETMQDMIVKWYYDHSTESDLVKRTQDIFSPMYTDCYILSVYSQTDEALLKIGTKKTDTTSVSQKIPLPDGSSLTLNLNPTYFYDQCNKIA